MLLVEGDGRVFRYPVVRTSQGGVAIAVATTRYRGDMLFETEVADQRIVTDVTVPLKALEIHIHDRADLAAA